MYKIVYLTLMVMLVFSSESIKTEEKVKVPIVDPYSEYMSAEEAAQFLNQEVEFVCTISGVHKSKSKEDHPTFLNIYDDHCYNPISIRYFEKDENKFKGFNFAGKRILVKGTIDEFSSYTCDKDVRGVKLTNSNQISIISD
jgi:hypothetical protein